MTNKQALARYLIIDELLRSPKMRTLEQIIEMVSDRMGMSISKRTIQLDIQEMRYNSILDFRAPIQTNKIGVKGKMGGKSYYSYSDKNYSIRTKLTHLDMTLIEIHDDKLATAVRVTIEEVELQNALINISASNYSSLKNIKDKMVEAADIIDEYEEKHISQGNMVEVLKELTAHYLRELSKYKNIIDAMDEIEA